MAMIIVDEIQDRRLENVVPDYLKGPRCITRRVLWAIDLAVRTQEGNGAAKSSDSDTEPTE